MELVESLSSGCLGSAQSCGRRAGVSHGRLSARSFRPVHWLRLHRSRRSLEKVKDCGFQIIKVVDEY